MSRRPRIHHKGAFYHIMLRGNNGQSIFFSDKDRCKFSLLLQEVSERFGLRVHGFCFMSNHVHLVIQVSEEHISAAIQNLTFRYTRYINFKEKRIGHLFQGRFKSILVEDGTYLIELVRYVHLNPVRAGMVSKPEDYRWSGHRALLGKEVFVWLTSDWVLSKFDPHENIARKCYEKFVNYESLADVDIEQFKKGSHDGSFLGSIEFVTNILKEAKDDFDFSRKLTLKELIEIICAKLGQPSSDMQLPGKERDGTKARSFVAYFVKKQPDLTLKAFADYVGKDISTLSKLARELEIKANKDEVTALILKELTNEINSQISKFQAQDRVQACDLQFESIIYGNA